MTTTAAQSITSPVTAPTLAYTGQDLNIPSVLLREPCHLEVLIPARNEANRLPHTLARTIRYLEQQEYTSSVVVIDNGSVDQTTDLVAKAWSERVPVHLTGCASPGKGAAVRRGILTSRAHFIGYMDADLATPIETLDVVVPLLEDYQVVVGSRRIRGATIARRQSMFRTMGSMVFRVLTKRILRDVTDTQCGFKFFTGDLARAVAGQLNIDGFAFDVEMLCAIAQLGVSIKEIPVIWSDVKGSTLHALRDGVRAAVDLYRLSRRRAT